MTQKYLQKILIYFALNSIFLVIIMHFATTTLLKFLSFDLILFIAIFLNTLLLSIQFIVYQKVYVQNNHFKSLFIANLTDNVKKDDLINLFSKYGLVVTASIIVDKHTNKSKGYGFVKMPIKAAIKAQAKLDNSEHFEQKLTVKFAKSKKHSYSKH